MSTGMLKAEAALDDLRAELGLGAAPTPIEATMKPGTPAAEIAAPAEGAPASEPPAS
jgi:hypothetical protein